MGQTIYGPSESSIKHYEATLPLYYSGKYQEISASRKVFIAYLREFVNSNRDKYTAQEIVDIITYTGNVESNGFHEFIYKSELESLNKILDDVRCEVSISDANFYEAQLVLNEIEALFETVMD